MEVFWFPRFEFPWCSLGSGVTSWRSSFSPGLSSSIASANLASFVFGEWGELFFPLFLYQGDTDFFFFPRELDSLLFLFPFLGVLGGEFPDTCCEVSLASPRPSSCPVVVLGLLLSVFFLSSSFRHGSGVNLEKGDEQEWMFEQQDCVQGQFQTQYSA